MISVIVPTMWQFKPFINFLQDLLQVSIIEEIIIINNLVGETPEEEVLNNPRIKIIIPESNLYVNPSWNYGVRCATTDRICILSDDVIVDPRVFYKIHDLINEDIGVIGIHPAEEIINLHSGNYKSSSTLDLDKLIVTGNIEIIKHTDESNWGFGSLFFLHKNNWIDIPENLKIHFGDTWIWDIQNHLQRSNYLIHNCFFYSPWNVTSSSGKIARSKVADSQELYDELLASWKTNLSVVVGDLNDK